MRTVRRPKTARCMTSAKARPMTSSTVTETTVMTAVANTACHQTPLDRMSA